MPHPPILFTLPWPKVTANQTWRFVVIQGKGRALLHKEARLYRRTVAAYILLLRLPGLPLLHSLDVELKLYPPPRTSVDVDNIGPVVLDALGHAGLWKNDYIIRRLVQERFANSADPRVEVTVRGWSAEG